MLFFANFILNLLNILNANDIWREKIFNEYIVTIIGEKN